MTTDETRAPGEQPRKVKVSLTEDQPLTEQVRGSLQTYIAGLSVPQKVELAAKGNKEVRQILSRDNSNLVARAVVNSPRLSEVDVMAFAASPQTNEDVLRGIGESREWSKNARVKMLLVTNPRTPPSIALRFLGHLAVSELNILVRNRNIPVVVRREAKRRAVKARQ